MKVLYVLKRYPRLSETFVVRELLDLEEGGTRTCIDALLPPEDGPRHADVARVRGRVRYLPRHPRLWHAPVALAHAAVAARRPVTWSRAALRARDEGTWRRFLQAGLVARRARREGVTHLHAHFATAAAEVARDAATLTGLPYTVTAHAKDIYARENVPWLDRRLGRAAAVVTVSDHNARYLTGRLGSRAQVRVVRNAIAPAEPVNRRPEGPVLCVARLVEKKGVDVLIRAIGLLAADRRGLRAEIVGDGPLRADLESLAGHLGVADRVTFLGALPADGVAAAYARCAVVALPCRVARDGDRDGLPTVLGEALARGLPAVSTDVVGIRELVRDRETGLLVEPEDAAALAVALAALLDDPALADRLGAAGRDLVRAEYDGALSADRLRAVFAGAPA